MNTRMCIASIVVAAGFGIGATAWAQTVSVDERALSAAMAAAARAAEIAQAAHVAESAQALHALSLIHI